MQGSTYYNDTVNPVLVRQLRRMNNLIARDGGVDG